MLLINKNSLNVVIFYLDSFGHLISFLNEEAKKKNFWSWPDGKCRDLDEGQLWPSVRSFFSIRRLKFLRRVALVLSVERHEETPTRILDVLAVLRGDSRGFVLACALESCRKSWKRDSVELSRQCVEAAVINMQLRLLRDNVERPVSTPAITESRDCRLLDRSVRASRTHSHMLARFYCHVRPFPLEIFYRVRCAFYKTRPMATCVRYAFLMLEKLNRAGFYCLARFLLIGMFHVFPALMKTVNP